MTDDDPSDDHRTREWPFEGHFVVGGSGLYLHRDCLGRTFTSHTASYDLEIGLPRSIRDRIQSPREIRQRLGEPAIPNLELIPVHGPTAQRTRTSASKMPQVAERRSLYGFESLSPCIWNLVAWMCTLIVFARLQANMPDGEGGGLGVTPCG